MFNKETIKKLNKYFIFWIVWCFIAGSILIYFSIDISNSMLANFLKDTIPAMELLEKSTKYPQLSVSLWSICWVSGIIFLIIIVYKFNNSFIDNITGKLLFIVLLMFLLSFWKLYMGMWTYLPDAHSGRISQFLNLTQFGIIINPSLSWIIFIFSITAVINILKKIIKE